MNPDLKKLAAALRDATMPDEHVRLIRRVARTEDPDAIAVLASQLDVPGPAGAEAVRALVSFGQLAVSEVRRCLQAKDEDMIRNAHRVLAALGDAHSARAQDAHCWADLDDEGWLADFDGLLSAFEAGRTKGTAAA